MRSQPISSPRIVLAGLALLVMLLLSAPSALASEGCPNEQLREESNINPTTGQPYDLSLPECRAYEMVSPLEKQQHDAMPLNRQDGRLAVASNGDAADWYSEGDYADPENYRLGGLKPRNPYVSSRMATGWETRSALAPTTLIDQPAGSELSGIVVATDFSAEAECGTVANTTTNVLNPGFRCALRGEDGLWLSTPEYKVLSGQEFERDTVLGASADASTVVFHGAPGAPFLGSDTSSAACEVDNCGGLYEVAGVGSATPELRLVDVDNSGEMIGPESGTTLGTLDGDDYHAISKNSSVIFFTATPTGGVPTIYARVDAKETVTISAPSPACTCSGPAREANYVGASASGDRVFFITDQQLASSDRDEGSDLYEYNFANPPGQRIVQVSRGGLGDLAPGSDAGVLGVIGVAEGGSHVYFATGGSVLTTVPNALGQKAAADPGDGANIYGYDTETGETEFVATVTNEDAQLWGTQVLNGSSISNVRLAQVNGDGRYLIFDTFAKLVTAGPEADTNEAEDIYRYDFDTGGLVRVSIGHEGAVIAPADIEKEGASPTVDLASRSINESGDLVAFMSTEPEMSPAPGTKDGCAEGGVVTIGGRGCQVYLWHECANGHCANGDSGEVSMVSDRDPVGVIFGGMSPSGADVFFQTRTRLVGQDTDSLGDIYDARIDGGFPAPAPEPLCSGEECQGTPAAVPTFAKPGTASFPGGGNLDASFTGVTVKTPTPAQRLTEALKRCKADRHKRVRVACEGAARRRYGKKRNRRGKS
jgi:hypothetical protein